MDTNTYDDEPALRLIVTFDFNFNSLVAFPRLADAEYFPFYHCFFILFRIYTQVRSRYVCSPFCAIFTLIFVYKLRYKK